MNHPLATVLLVVALPIVGLLGGGRLFVELSGRQESAGRGTPLFMRFTGYSVTDVATYWSDIASGGTGLKTERRFLELDLIFPFVYGGALCTSLLLLWTALGRTFSPAIPVVLIALTILADWCENLIQLRQLELFVALGAKGLQEGWMRLASIATIVKLTGTCLGFAAVFLLAAVCALRR